jgi:hypothetical protein
VGYARDMRGVVSFGLIPAIVDEEMIEAIKGKLEKGYVTTPASTFNPGQVVRIQEGRPWTGRDLSERDLWIGSGGAAVASHIISGKSR